MSLKEPPETDQGAPTKVTDEFFTPYALDCMKRAVAEAIADHHRVGNPVYVWKNGGIVQLHPDGSMEPVEPV